MYKQHRSFQSIGGRSKIWRYMNFVKFTSFLSERALYFCRVDKLGDPFEGTLTRHAYELLLAAAERRQKLLHGSLESRPEQLIQGFTSARSNSYANCWHIGRYESAAMWSIYSEKGQGIAVQSTFNRLSQSFSEYSNDVYIGRIRYIDFGKDAIDLSNAFNPILIKRKGFEHEKEVRAVVSLLGSSPTLESPAIPEDGFYVPVVPGDLVQRIFLAPNSKSWFRELVQSVIRAYDYNFSVVHSDFDRQPIR